MNKQRIAIAIVSLFTASLAHAQYFYGPPPGPPPPSPGPEGSPWPAGMGPYFRSDIGPTFFQNSMIKSFSSPPNLSLAPPYPGVNGPPGRVHYNVGVAFDAAFGWQFNRYVGLDFDTGYIWGEMDSVQNYQANNSAMGNVPFIPNLVLSLPIPHTNIVPYIGGGAGGSVSIFNAHNFTYPGTGDYVDGSESDVVFAWQAFAGVRFQISQGLYLGVGYQYFATGNPTFSYGSDVLPNLDTQFQGVRTHSIMFTLQATF